MPQTLLTMIEAAFKRQRALETRRRDLEVASERQPPALASVELESKGSSTATRQAHPDEGDRYDDRVLFPVALDAEGQLVSARDATAKQAPFRCITCRARMSLRSGAIRVRHFSHQGSSVAAACHLSGETVAHYEAKMALRDTRRMLTFYVLCRTCMTNHATEISVDTRPPARVVVEHAIEPFRIDAAVLRDDAVVLAIEVCVTHRVPDAKWRSLEAPLVEAAAEDITHGLESDRPIKAMRIKNEALVCRSCRVALLQRIEFGKFCGRRLFEVDTEYLFGFLADMHRRVSGFLEDVVGNGRCLGCDMMGVDASSESTCWCRDVLSQPDVYAQTRCLVSHYEQISERVYERRFIYLLRFHPELVKAAKYILRTCFLDRSRCVACHRPTQHRAPFCYACWRNSDEGRLIEYYRPFLDADVKASLS